MLSLNSPQANRFRRGTSTLICRQKFDQIINLEVENPMTSRTARNRGGYRYGDGNKWGDERVALLMVDFETPPPLPEHIPPTISRGCRDPLSMGAYHGRCFTLYSQ